MQTQTNQIMNSNGNHQEEDSQTISVANSYRDF